MIAKTDVHVLDKIKSLEINIAHQRVLVETCLPWKQILTSLEETGKNAVLMGAGCDVSMPSAATCSIGTAFNEKFLKLVK